MACIYINTFKVSMSDIDKSRPRSLWAFLIDSAPLLLPHGAAIRQDAGKVPAHRR